MLDQYHVRIELPKNLTPVWLGLAVAGCMRSSNEIETFAQTVVEAARSDAGIGPMLVDDTLVERVRRVQLARRTLLDTAKLEPILQALSGETGPDRQYPPAERSARQRQRASRGLRANAVGGCRIRADSRVAHERLRFLTEPPQGAPPPLRAEQEALARDLRDAEAVRLDCRSGPIGLLAQRDADRTLRAVDIFSIGASSFEVNPNDPQMK